MTDSPYVVASMGIMTRMGTPVLNKLAEGVEFVRCQHSVGRPLPLKGADSKSLNRVLFVICISFCNILYIFLPFILFPPFYFQLLWWTRGPATQKRCWYPTCPTPGRSSPSAVAMEGTLSLGKSALPCASPPASPKMKAGWLSTCWLECYVMIMTWVWIKEGLF